MQVWDLSAAVSFQQEKVTRIAKCLQVVLASQFPKDVKIIALLQTQFVLAVLLSRVYMNPDAMLWTPEETMTPKSFTARLIKLSSGLLNPVREKKQTRVKMVVSLMVIVYESKEWEAKTREKPSEPIENAN